MAAFVALVIATVGAFFVTQHLKVTTPLIQGRPAPVPNTINPAYGGSCALRDGKGQVRLVSFRRTRVSFYLQNRSDNVDVWIVDHAGDLVRQIGSNVFMRARPPGAMSSPGTVACPTALSRPPASTTSRCR